MSNFLKERVVWTYPDGDLVVTEYRNCPDLVPEDAAEHLEEAKDGHVTVPRRVKTPAKIDKQGKITKEAVLELVSVAAFKEVRAEALRAAQEEPGTLVTMITELNGGK